MMRRRLLCGLRNTWFLCIWLHSVFIFTVVEIRIVGLQTDVTQTERTFIAAQLYFGEKADLNDLPQESQHQVRFALLQILSSDVDNLAADGRRRVQSQVEILLLMETQGDKDWEPRTKIQDKL